MHHHSQKKGVNVKSIWFQILGIGPSSSVSNTFPCKHLDLLHVLYKEEEHCMTTAGKWALCRLEDKNNVKKMKIKPLINPQNSFQILVSLLTLAMNNGQ